MSRFDEPRRPHPASRLLLATLLALLAGPGGPGACRTSPEAASSSSLLTRIELLADAEEVEVGVDVTLTLRTDDALPDNPDLHWISSGGHLVASDTRRSARVRFAEPGEYRVSVTLFDRDRIVDAHTVRISVRPPR